MDRSVFNAVWYNRNPEEGMAFYQANHYLSDGLSLAFGMSGFGGIE